MRVLIVDDERPARERLRDLLAEIGAGVGVVGEAGNGVEALRLIAETEPDLVLMDIRMPGMGGLQAARAIARLPHPPAVVFVTAHDEFALEAFEVSAADYLLKPVRRERLETALRKAQRFTEAVWEKLAPALPPEHSPTRTYLLAQGHGRMELVPVASVAYFRAEQKYTTVRTDHGEALIEDSLISLEHEFGETFLRVHRNALVAAERLAGLERLPDGGLGIRLAGIPETLEVSRRHLAGVRARLKRMAGT